MGGYGVTSKPDWVPSKGKIDKNTVTGFDWLCCGNFLGVATVFGKEIASIAGRLSEYKMRSSEDRSGVRLNARRWGMYGWLRPALSGGRKGVGR